MKCKVNDISYLALYVHGILYVPLMWFYDIMSKAMLHIIMFHTPWAPYIICNVFLQILPIINIWDSIFYCTYFYVFWQCLPPKVKLVLIHQPIMVYSITCYLHLHYIIKRCNRFYYLPKKIQACFLNIIEHKQLNLIKYKWKLKKKIIESTQRSIDFVLYL